MSWLRFGQEVWLCVDPKIDDAFRSASLLCAGREEEGRREKIFFWILDFATITKKSHQTSRITTDHDSRRALRNPEHGALNIQPKIQPHSTLAILILSSTKRSPSFSRPKLRPPCIPKGSVSSFDHLFDH